MVALYARNMDRGAVAIGMSEQKDGEGGCLLGLIGGIAALVGFVTAAMAVILSSSGFGTAKGT